MDVMHVMLLFYTKADVPCYLMFGSATTVSQPRAYWCGAPFSRRGAAHRLAHVLATALPAPDAPL